MNTTKTNLYSFAYLALIASLITGCNLSEVGSNTTDDTLQKVQQEKLLRVAYINYPPSAYKDEKTGQMSGHFVDAIRDITDQISPQIKIEFVETNWADFTNVLNTKRADLSISGTFTTIPRAKLVTFTRPLVYLGRGAVVRNNDNRWKSNMSLAQFDQDGIKVGVVNGEGSHEFVKATFKHQENIVVFDGQDLSQSLAAVSSGQVDVGLSDSLETTKYTKTHSEVKDIYADSPVDIMPIAWSVRHSDIVWKNFLDTAINMLEVQGKLTLWEKQYGFMWTKPQFDLKPRF